MEIKFEVVLDTNGDEVDTKELHRWENQIKEVLDKQWYVKSVEVADGQNEQR